MWLRRKSAIRSSISSRCQGHHPSIPVNCHLSQPQQSTAAPGGQRPAMMPTPLQHTGWALQQGVTYSTWGGPCNGVTYNTRGGPCNMLNKPTVTRVRSPAIDSCNQPQARNLRLLGNNLDLTLRLSQPPAWVFLPVRSVPDASLGGEPLSKHLSVRPGLVGGRIS